jgi:hypothetical protein
MSNKTRPARIGSSPPRKAAAVTASPNTRAKRPHKPGTYIAHTAGSRAGDEGSFPSLALGRLAARVSIQPGVKTGLDCRPVGRDHREHGRIAQAALLSRRV